MGLSGLEEMNRPVRVMPLGDSITRGLICPPPGMKPGGYAFFPRTPLCYAVSDDGDYTWEKPFIVDDEGAERRDHQSIYPAICFLPEGILVKWSMHAADPQGSFDN